MRARVAIAAIGAAAHVALLLAPLALAGIARAALDTNAGRTLLVLASALVVGEVVVRSGPLERSRPPLHAIASAGGLLLVYWAALFDLVRDSLLADRTILPLRAAAPSLLPIAGAVLFAGGIALRLLSIRALGRYFVSEVRVEPEQPLVTTGPYRWVRHPSDAGLLLVVIGAALLSRSIAALAIGAVVVLPSVLVRVKAEDRLLGLRFAAHGAYAARTGALVPLARTRS